MAVKFCPICREVMTYDHDCTYYDFASFPYELELHGLTLGIEPNDFSFNYDYIIPPRQPKNAHAFTPGRAGDMPLFLRL